MSKGLLDLIIDSIFDEKWIGSYGERLTERELKLVQLFGRKGKTLRNIYLPKDKDGETSEVDLVFITQKGIFVFESKNYSGWIFGDEKSRYWTVSLPNGQKNRFYNPVLQNRTHLKWLRSFVGDSVPLFSVIVFSERCELKKIQMQSDNIKVIKRDWTYATVRNIWNASPDALSGEMVNELYDKLKVLTNVDEAVKAAHVDSIRNRFDNGEKAEAPRPVQNTASVSASSNDEPGAVRICPRCGEGKLVIRTVKNGKNAGTQFFGCSNFPHCRYMKPEAEET